jgi:serine/threonine-protein kinase
VASGQRTRGNPSEDGEIRTRAPVDLEIGEVIAGKYAIERLLGRGGMGTVWLCLHLGLRERVAVKVMSRQVADNGDVRARFEREARASAKIKSRYVARVYDTGELADGRPYLVMEYMEGETLGQALHAARTMSLEDTVRILGQVGRGLARAHELGVVHRDIKPDNVFLAHTADDGVIAKVFDFGIVKLSDAIAMSSDMTQEGALLGTPQYMSPEQVEGVPIDLRSDIYSLGVMAFRMLSGKRLFPGESLSATLMKICNGPLPSLTEAAPGVPEAVETWFRRACARDREARFSSALECVEALVVAAGMPRPESSLSLPGQPMASGASGHSGFPLETPSGPSAAPWMPPSGMTGMGFGATERPRGTRGKVGLLVGLALAAVVALIFVLARGSHESPPPPVDTAAARSAPTASASSALPLNVAPASPPAPSTEPAPASSAPVDSSGATTQDAAPRPTVRPASPPVRRGPRSVAPGASSAPDERIHDVGY